MITIGVLNRWPNILGNYICMRSNLSTWFVIELLDNNKGSLNDYYLLREWSIRIEFTVSNNLLRKLCRV